MVDGIDGNGDNQDGSSCSHHDGGGEDEVDSDVVADIFRLRACHLVPGSLQHRHIRSCTRLVVSAPTSCLP